MPNFVPQSAGDPVRTAPTVCGRTAKPKHRHEAHRRPTTLGEKLALKDKTGRGTVCVWRTPWRQRQGVVDQVRRRLRHAPGLARRARAASLAAERDQLVVAAVAAAESQETVGQNAAFEEGVELVLEELRQVGAGSVFGLGKEGRGVLLHQAVERGLFRWRQLLPADKSVLRLLADGTATLQAEATRKRLGTELGVPVVSPATVQNALARLVQQSLLTKVAYGRYAFVDEAFADWVLHVDLDDRA
jgi:hypothetical protein